MVRAEHHGLVDVLDGGDAGLNEADGFVDHGDEDLVDDEAGSLGDLDRLLADLLGELVDEIEGLLRGVRAADDLNELHAGNGIEEVHTDDGVLEAKAHLGDGQRGGVGGKDGGFLAQLIQLAEHGALVRHLFLGALNDEVGIGGGGLLLHEDIRHQGILGLLSHLALLDALLQGSVELVLVALRGSDAGRVHQSGVAVCREDLRDAAAHGAGAENCNFHFCVPPMN